MQFTWAPQEKNWRFPAFIYKYLFSIYFYLALPLLLRTGERQLVRLIIRLSMVFPRELLIIKSNRLTHGHKCHTPPSLLGPYATLPLERWLELLKTSGRKVIIKRISTEVTLKSRISKTCNPRGQNTSAPELEVKVHLRKGCFPWSLTKKVNCSIPTIRQAGR